jgi:hypothetical protein
MGYGEAVMEQQVFRKGLHKIPSLLDYKLPTTLDTPEIETILIEIPDLEGPFGGKEAGQGPLNPVIPAIANAVYDAIGVRIDEVPIMADKVLKALKAEAGVGTGTSRTIARPQVMPTEGPSPWPTRLIRWRPDGDKGKAGDSVGDGGDSRITTRDGGDASIPRGDGGDASVPSPLHTSPAPTGLVEREGSGLAEREGSLDVKGGGF